MRCPPGTAHRGMSGHRGAGGVAAAMSPGDTSPGQAHPRPGSGPRCPWRGCRLVRAPRSGVHTEAAVSLWLGFRSRPPGSGRPSPVYRRRRTGAPAPRRGRGCAGGGAAPGGVSARAWARRTRRTGSRPPAPAPNRPTCWTGSGPSVASGPPNPPARWIGSRPPASASNPPTRSTRSRPRASASSPPHPRAGRSRPARSRPTQSRPWPPGQGRVGTWRSGDLGWAGVAEAVGVGVAARQKRIFQGFF